MSSGRGVLISCYFPRSVELEGVGSLVRGLARTFVAGGWDVTLLMPQGQYVAQTGVRVETYRPGLLSGLTNYRYAIGKHSQHMDAVLLVENNPNLARCAEASAVPDKTLCLFCTPLQTLALVGEMGLSRQAIVHALAKHRMWAKRIDWTTKRCIVGSAYQARQLQALGARDVRVLPVCGVSRDAAVPTRDEARRRLEWDDTPVAGYLGHYSPAKGVDVLVQAFAACKSAGVLALAHSGKGRLGASATAALASLRQQGRVREIGVCDPLTFLAACDVVALPYITTSIFHQPQVMLESMAASTAVITTGIGGFPELIRSMGCGVIVPPRDPAALAKAIDTCLGDLPSTRQWGTRGRAAFEQRCCAELLPELVDAQAASHAGVQP